MVCNKCGLRFQLGKHHNNLVHLNLKEIRCTFCAKLFYDIDTMFDHVLEHDGTTFCYICDQHFDNYEQLFDHIDIHLSLHVYGCSKCYWTTGNVIKYLDHVCNENYNSSGHDSGVESPVTDDPIPMISLEPRNKETLKFIAKCKDSDGYYKCPLCGKQLVTLRGIRNHLFRHYGLHRYVCGICGRKCLSHSKLKEHEANHISPIYKCPVRGCRKSFSSIYRLNSHSIVHKGGYVCANCDLRFSCKSRLKNHLKIRKCCRQIFGCNRMYEKHLLFVKHLFCCIYCDESYRSAVELKFHQSSSHKESLACRYKCRLCDTLFLTVYNFKRHLRRRHKMKLSFVNFNDYNSLENKNLIA